MSIVPAGSQRVSPSYKVIAGAAWLAAVLAGCSGSDSVSEAPLPLTDGNAADVAAEVLVSTGGLGNTSSVPLGGSTLATADVTRISRDLATRVLWQRLAAQSAAAGPVADVPAPSTQACEVSGTNTTVVSMSSPTAMTATVTFNSCAEESGVVMNGTVTYSFSGDAASGKVAISATLNLTITRGTLVAAESGSYSLSIDFSSGTDAIEITSPKLNLSVSSGGSVRDKATLSKLDLLVQEDLAASPPQSILTETFQIDSTRLAGHVAVTTPDPLKETHAFPYTGQVLITGAGSSCLQLTVKGDETYVAPAGEGQVELQIDTGTGSFGAPTWKSWADLQASATTM